MVVLCSPAVKCGSFVSDGGHAVQRWPSFKHEFERARCGRGRQAMRSVGPRRPSKFHLTIRSVLACFCVGPRRAASASHRCMESSELIAPATNLRTHPPGAMPPEIAMLELRDQRKSDPRTAGKLGARVAPARGESHCSAQVDLIHFSDVVSKGSSARSERSPQPMRGKQPHRSRIPLFFTSSGGRVWTPVEGVNPPKGKARSLTRAWRSVGAGPRQIVGP